MKPYPDFGAVMNGKQEFMSCMEIGAAIVLASYFWNGGTEISRDNASRMICNRGIESKEAEAILDMLCNLSIMELNASGLLTMPGIEQMRFREAMKNANRKAGWESRRAKIADKVAGRVDGVAVEQNQSPAPTLVPEPNLEPSQKSDPSFELTPVFLESSSGIKTTEASKPKSKRKYRRNIPSVLEAPLPDGSDGDTIIAEIPCRDGTLIKVMKSWVEKIKKAFPLIDVEREVIVAAAWSQANPLKRKTPSGIERFLVTWFNNATDRQKMRMIAGSSKSSNGFNSGNRNFSPKLTPVSGDFLDEVHEVLPTNQVTPSLI